MENLNAEYIKVALKCHSDPKNKCEICPYNKKCCSMALSTDALALINSQEQDKEKLGLLIDEIVKEKRELFEENKRLTEENERLRAEAKTDTVREILAKVKERAYYDTTETGITHMVIGTDEIDEIAKELIGE